MSAPFAPLIVPTAARSAEGASFRLKVIPQAGAVPAFKPLQPAPRLTTAAAAPALAPHTEHASSPPKVTLEREGDRVTLIRVECGCGEVFELACVY